MTAVSTRDKAVTGPLLDKSLLGKTGRVCDPFFLDVTAKLEHTFFDGVIQCLSSLHFIPKLVMFAQNLILCLSLLSVVKESKFRVC